MAAFEETIQDLKIVSWNINSIRTYNKEGFKAFVAEHDPDIFCFNEIKVSERAYLLPPEVADKYPHRYWNSCPENAGYSGTLILSKIKPTVV